MWPFHVGVSLIVICFVWFKSGYLGLPLFWDEAWVYGPAVRAMYANGPSLLPDAIDPELTRGHPLLFHFLTTLWMSVFGTSNTTLHAFALTISVLVLVATYLVGSRISSPLVGIVSALLVAVDESFLTQSGVLLPEVLLALFVLLTFLMFIVRSTVGYILFGTCALFIKESAIVALIAIMVWQVVLLLKKDGHGHSTSPLKWSIVSAIPLLIASLFFLIQYLRFGWVFYPEHLGLMSFDVKDVHYKFKFAFNLLFEHQGNEWITYAFGLAVPILWRAWKPWTGVAVAMIYVAAVKVLVGRWPIPPFPTLMVTLTCFALIFHLQFLRLHSLKRKEGEFTAIGLIFLLGFLLFSSLNFFTDRYLICLVPVIALGISVWVREAVPRYPKWILPCVMAVLCGARLLSIGKDDRTSDTRLAYTDLISVHEAMVGYLEHISAYDEPIHASFVEEIYLTDPNAGYLKGRPFTSVDNRSGSPGYLVFTNVSPTMEHEEAMSQGTILLERFTTGKAWGEIRFRGPLVPGNPSR